MAIERIGLNFTELNNLTFSQFDTSKTATDYLTDIPNIANSSTNYWYGWGVIVSMFVILFSQLREPEQTGGFGYDEGQAFALTSAITFIFGLLFVMVGYIQSFKPVGIMGGLFLAINLYIVYTKNDR